MAAKIRVACTVADFKVQDDHFLCYLTYPEKHLFVCSSQTKVGGSQEHQHLMDCLTSSLLSMVLESNYVSYSCANRCCLL